jgi:alkyldihydroxyacetonephosphate synthase
LSGVADDLARLLGSDGVSVEEEDLRAHARDWSATALLQERTGADGSLPSCIVRPADEEGVVELLRWAQETQTPVVPFGGGSGVCRGIEAEDMVVVDLARLDTIFDVDERSRTARVGAGCNGGKLQRTLAGHGLMLGHQPQSIDISTVGGWVATRACGQLSAGYGGIEDALVGLGAVLPGGDVVRTRSTPRASVGPDFASLMIGSEGSLGIVTEATLRVYPIPSERSGVSLRFEHMAEGVAACRKLAQSALHPAVVRLYDREDAALFLRNHPDEEVTPLLILAFDGEQAGHRAERAVQLTGGRRGDDALVAHWWEHRNDAVGEFRNLMAGTGLLGPHALVDTMEVSGTWSHLRDLYHSMKEALSAAADICACHISHVYPDGACLYFTLASAPESDDAAVELHGRWWKTGMDACVAAGGSISHHHGIGRLKAAWLPDELGGWYSALRAIKRAVDPNRIMNPGVLGL